MSRHEIRFWSRIIFVILAILVIGILWLLKRKITYYKASGHPSFKHYPDLLFLNFFSPIIPAILFATQVLPKAELLSELFEDYPISYPITMTLNYAILFGIIGMTLEYILFLMNPEYRKFKTDLRNERN